MTEKQTASEYSELINKEYSWQEAIQVLDKIDWDFKGFTTQYLTHTFHSYPARFIPQIPLSFIKLFTKEKETVLDPMCGCGTTIVEAFLNNRNSIGNDFNPLATLITKVKTTLISKNEFKYFNGKIARIKHYETINKKDYHSPNRETNKVFTGIVALELENIYEILMEIKEEGYSDLFDFGRVALSSTVWSLIENSRTDVYDIFLKKVKSMQNNINEMAKVIRDIPEVEIICGDARELKVNTNSIDLIVTSPPYVNALDYHRIHMHNMRLLGMDLDLFKKHEIGKHSHFVTNRFRLLSEYLGDMLRAMIEMNRVLKEDKFCVIVIGNSSLEYELIESYKFFIEMCKKIGFEPVKIIFRNIDKTKKYASADIGKIDDEYIIVMRKVYDAGVSASDDNFVSSIVKEQMISFRERIKRYQGTSIKGRRPTDERLLKNIEKISDAIETIPEDVKMKK